MTCDPLPDGVKYCGGCNPRFDRVAAVQQLGFAHAPAACPGVCYDTLLVVCGCTARCADLSGLSARRTVLISTPEELEQALRQAAAAE